MAVNFPANPNSGDAYVYSGRTWRFDGVRWATALSSASANTASTIVSNSQPSGNVIAGTLWLNQAANTTQIYNGSSWSNVSGGGSILVSNSQPSSTETGTLWFNGTDSTLKVYDGSTWASMTITSDQLDLGNVSITLPTGNTAQRPDANSAIAGMFRYNSDITTTEMYTDVDGWTSIATVVPPPVIASISPTTYNGEQGTSITLTGENFTADAIVSFVDIGLNSSNAAITMVVNANSIMATTPVDYSASQGPLTIKVTQDSGSYTLATCLSTGSAPVWSTLSGSLGTVYEGGNVSYQLSAPDSDANATVSFSLYTGTLPTGTTLSSSGLISGTIPQTDSPATFSFTVRATDNAGSTSDRNFSISTATSSVTWTTAAGALTQAVVGTSYSQNVVASTNSSHALSYSVYSGSLPTGLSLNASTGEISGTPSGSVGTASFTIRASNSFRTADRAFTINVDSLVAATGGTVTTVGNVKYHTFQNSGTFTVTNPGNVTIMMVGGGGGAGSGGGGGGGGAGGYVYKSGVAVSAQGYTITIGSGGAGAASTSAGPPYGSDGVVKFASSGSNTTAFGHVAVGGGAGGSNNAGTTGGCGGGGASGLAGASSNQGVNDADGVGYGGAAGPGSTGGGGGGVGAAGSTVNGGDGIAIAGPTSLNIGGGGYGGNQSGPTGTSTYGGGYGGNNGSGLTGSSAATNTGGGGGGGYTGGCCYGFYMSPGGTGGSGIVIIKYPTSF